VPQYGMMAGIDMFGGPDCATLRSIFVLSSGFRGLILTLCVFTILLSIALGIWLYLTRAHPLIKASSPIFGAFICFGSVMAAIAVIVDISDTNAGSCNSTLWILVGAFVLVFVSLFAKTYRLHRIFNNKRLVESRWTQSRLLRIMTYLALFDFLLLFVLAVVDPLRPRGFIDSSSDFGVVVQCSANKLWLYYFLLFAYNGGLLLWGIYVTLRVRNINLAAFNESRPLASAIYNLTFVAVALLPICFVFANQPTFFYVFKNFLVLYVVIFTQGAMYLPKFLTLRDTSNPQNDPRFWNKGVIGNSAKGQGELGEGLLGATTDLENVDLTRTNQLLIQRIAELEAIIKEKDKRIDELQSMIDENTLERGVQSHSRSGSRHVSQQSTSPEGEPPMKVDPRKTAAWVTGGLQ